MKTSSLFRIVVALALGTVATFQTGCVAVAVGAGAGAVAYIRGELSGDVAYGMKRTLAASNEAVQELGFAKVSERSDALTGTIVARTADDKKVEIRLERLTDTTTKVKIRVGVFGDQAISMQVWDRIKEGL